MTPPNATEPPFLTRLRRAAQIIRIKRRQTLPTAASDHVYFVRSGLVAAENATIETRHTMVELLYPGAIIAPALLPVSAGISYSTLADTEVWRLGMDDLKSEMTSDASVAEFVLRSLNLQCARMQLHIAVLAGLTSEQKVAALLLKAACHFGTSAGGRSSFAMPLSRSEVAEYLALNADTLSRIMSRLQRDNILARSSRAQTTIHNMDALKALCPLGNAVMTLHGS